MIIFKVKVDDQGTKTITELGNKAKKIEAQFNLTGSAIFKAFSGVMMYSGVSKVIQSISQVSDELNKFHLNLKKIEVIGGITGKGINELSLQIRNLAVNTEYSHSQISEAGLVLTRMGYTTSKAIGGTLTGSMNLATVAGEDLLYTTQGLAQIINAFGLQGRPTTEVVNKIGVALNATALNLKDFIEAMQYSASIAKAAGLSFEDTTTMIAYLSQISVTGSRAGTTLRNSIGGLIDPTDKVTAAIAKHNIKANDMVGILQAMKDEGLGLKDFKDMFGQWALSGTLGMSQNIDLMKKLQEQVYAGTADIDKQAADIRQMAIPAYKQMWSAITEIGEALSQALGISKGELIRGLRDEFLKVSKYISNNKDEFLLLGQAIKKVSEVFSGILKFGIIGVLGSFKELGVVAGIIFGAMAISNIGRYIYEFKKVRPVVDHTSDGLKIFGKHMMNFGNYVTGVAALSGAIVILMNAIIDLRREAQKNSAANLEKSWGSEGFVKDLTDFRKAAEDVKNFELQNTSNKNILLGLEGYRNLTKILDEKKKFFETYYGIKINKKENIFAKIDELLKLNKKPIQMDDLEIKPDKVTIGVPETIDTEKLVTYIKPRIGIGDLFKTPKNLTNPATVDLNRNLNSALMSNLQSDDAGLLFTGATSKFENSELMQTLRQTTLKEPKEPKEKKKDKKSDWDKIMQGANATTDLVGNVYNIMYELEQRKHNQIVENIEKEQTALESRYNRELVAAGDNTFKKTMIEQKYQQKREELEKKAEVEKDRIAKAEKRRAIFQAGLDAGLAVLGVIRDTKGGVIGRTVAGISMAAIAAGFIATYIANANYRSGGVVEGPGNATSDSIMARLSKGERVLSVDELRKLGGNERVNTLIDRPNTTNNNRNININVDNFIGTKQFAREFKNMLQEELSR